MNYINFNKDWKFWEEQNAFALVWNIPEQAVDVTLSHDAMLLHPAFAESKNGGNTGFRDGGVYNYVKMLRVPEDYRAKTVKLKFEGVYEHAFVYVNGQLAGKNPYGYSVFYVDIKDYLQFGQENEIRVIVRNGAMTNSRWYSGGGIYRDVYLCLGELTHIAADGIQVTTESLDEEGAVLRIETELENHQNHLVNTRLETRIYSNSGHLAAHDSAPVALFIGEKRKLVQRVFAANPKCWSDETPNLYTCQATLGEFDKDEISFGIRTMTLDAQRGLRINGKQTKLRGACIHHDSGLLGAATYECAQYRQISILKKAGFNAIRMSHQPAAPAMLRVCDKLGMYVMDETFDMWTRGKSDYDYSMNFAEYWEKDVESMVRKDYNHPSVILYSVGNEIPEIGTDAGAKICHDICRKVKSLDPTRYTLASINGVFAAGDAVGEIVADVVAGMDAGEQTEGNVNDFMTLMDRHLDQIVVHPAISKRLEKACAATDIAGYNYMTARYEQDQKDYPNRIIVGSETYPPEIARNWELVKKLPHVIGDFTWTGWDYIGEAGVGIPAYQWGEGGFGAKFPAQLAYVGDMDLTGFRRPASYYREIVFGLRKEPYIAVQNPKRYGQTLIKTPWVISDSLPDWTYTDQEGMPVIIEVYAPGEEVELFLNDTLLGKKPAGSKSGFITRFETLYKPGVLRAVAYENDKVIGTSQLRTAGTKRVLEANVEDGKTEHGKTEAGKTEAGKTQEELIYVSVELKDEYGTLIMGEDQEIMLAAEGAEVLGFGSGNPKTDYSYQTEKTKMYHGRALAILKRNETLEDNRLVSARFWTETGLEIQI